MACCPVLPVYEEIGLFKFEERRIVLIKLFENLGHNDLSHKLGFVSDLIFITIELNSFLLPLIKQNGGSMGPPEFLIVVLIHALSFFDWLKITKAGRKEARRLQLQLTTS